MAFRKGGKGTGANRGDTRSSIPINQTGHGFTVPQVVYLDDSDSLYKLAKADVLATANAIGVVSGVQNVNNFTLTTAGANNIFSGLTEGVTSYVSDTVAGALTETEPTISRPMLNAISDTRAIIFVDGIKIKGAGGSDTEVLFNNNGVPDGDPSFTFDEPTKLVTCRDMVVTNDLTVRGTTTSVNSEVVNIGDNHISLNAGNTLLSDESGGIIVNTGIIGTAFEVSDSFVPGVASTSNPSVTLEVAASFATNDIVEVSGTLHNDGVYEVLSFTSNVLTVRGVGNTATVEQFTNNQFQTEAAGGEIVKINASVILVNDNSSRLWGEATGSTTSTSDPFVFDYFNEGNLPYVVGLENGAIPYKYNTIQSAIDAVEASSSSDSVIVVTPGLYMESLTISATVSITSITDQNDITFILGNVSIATSGDIILVVIDGIKGTGAVTTSGSSEIRLELNSFNFRLSSASATLSLGNTNSLSTLRAFDSQLENTLTGPALARTAGSTSVFLDNCQITGDVDFSGTNGSFFDTVNIIIEGEVDLSNSTITSRFDSPSIITTSSAPCLDLTSSGKCIMIGGLLDVQSGGNVVTPATGADFEFANVATTSGTLLTTAMGTRLRTDGVALKSDGSGGANYLDDSGDYSAPATIYTDNGVINTNRTVEISDDKSLDFTAFDNATHSVSDAEAKLKLISGVATFALLDLDGAGGTDSIASFVLTPAGMLITDTTNAKGLVYAADYQGNFTDQSLVSKKYVDDNPVNIFTSNGSSATERLFELLSGVSFTITANNTAIAEDTIRRAILFMVSTEFAFGHDLLDGNGTITSSQRLTFNNAEMTVLDTNNSKGLVYDSGTYRVNFTDLSLVDKKYVDDNQINIFTSDGSMSVDRTVTVLDSSFLKFQSFNASDIATATGASVVDIEGSMLRLVYQDFSSGTPGANHGFLLTSAQMLVIDGSNKGLVNAADYSANFVDRSLIDKEYADKGQLSRSTSGAADLTSSGMPILAVTDSSASRTVTISTADINEGQPFHIKDEGGLAGTNAITVTTEIVAVTVVADASPGTNFTVPAEHGYIVGQAIQHTDFSVGAYDGLFTVTAIVSNTVYEVSTLTFSATSTGNSRTSIDDQISVAITANYGSLSVYCSETQVFTIGV
ncbi:MAG: hypothetical protein V3V40_06265 [Nitrosomonadaceae bacterium]